MIIRSAVTRFAYQMELKLQENDHKDGWEGAKIGLLLRALHGEYEELLLATHPLQLDTIQERLTPEDAREIVRECADVANFAMMIADNVQGKMENKE